MHVPQDRIAEFTRTFPGATAWITLAIMQDEYKSLRRKAKKGRLTNPFDVRRFVHLDKLLTDSEKV